MKVKTKHIFSSNLISCIRIFVFIGLDLDECASADLNDCDVVNGRCINEYTSYYCACNSGFLKDNTGTCTGKMLFDICRILMCTAILLLSIVILKTDSLGLQNLFSNFKLK